jgi:hypothetical protein
MDGAHGRTGTGADLLVYAVIGEDSIVGGLGEWGDDLRGNCSSTPTIDEYVES